MVSVSRALRQVKDDLPRLIEQHAHEALSQFPDFLWRDRLLSPVVMLLLFITQVMHGNTAITHLRHLAGLAFTATAYCKARQRLPLSLVQQITRSVSREVIAQHDDDLPRWRGHRVWRADGSGFSMPDTPELQDHFGQSSQQRTGCGFPVATLLLLCDAAGFIHKTLALPLRAHEAAHVADLHEHLEAGDVLAYDRAGCSYAHLALLFQRHLHAICRLHQGQIADFRRGRKHAGQYPAHLRYGVPRSQWLKRLGKQDQLVRWFKPKRRPAWMGPADYEALPDSLVLRELRYSISRPGFRTESVTLVTTLTDAAHYPASELAAQYRDRWSIELNLRHLKQTMGMDVLKCQSVDGVLKELAVFVLVYNLVWLVMLRAAQRQKVPLDRISFIDALRWLRDAPDRHERMALWVNPKRPDRVEPRAVKRRPKAYPRMDRPRHELRNMLMSAGVRA